MNSFEKIYLEKRKEKSCSLKSFYRIARFRLSIVVEMNPSFPFDPSPLGIEEIPLDCLFVVCRIRMNVGRVFKLEINFHVKPIKQHVFIRRNVERGSV